MRDIVLVGIHGATGKMGQSVLLASEHEYGVKINYQYSKNSNQHNLDKMLDICDIIIDFSHKDGLLKLLSKSLEYRKGLVIGTTGIPSEIDLEIKKAAKYIPIFYSANMSYGINLLAKIVSFAAQFLDQQYDVDIIETHHRYKKDAPSGTALMLGRQIAKARRQNFDAVKIFNRSEGQLRKAGDLDFSSIRSGINYGKHEIIFANEHETLSFKHQANSRDLFAKTALRAAKWLHHKPSGLYSMEDLSAFSSSLAIQ
jgi:4-hydroxy-tetrahydrodipicolinate reductase